MLSIGEFRKTKNIFLKFNSMPNVLGLIILYIRNAVTPLSLSK